jgi:xanthine dehydrogenase small subunit
LANAVGKHIVTVEGINTMGLNFIQQCFAREGATQCGFCTPGFVVSLTGFCLSKAVPGIQAGLDSVNGNICRCTGYKSIERAIAAISGKLMERGGEDALEFAVRNNLLPAYFRQIKERLNAPEFKPKNEIRPTSPGAQLLAGGTDLYVQQHESLENAAMEFLLDKKDLKGIGRQGNKCVMGAAVTVTDMLESPVLLEYFPSLRAHMKLVSSTQIRNMATIGGNIVNASPIGDLTIFFLALEAIVVLSDGMVRREIPLQNLFMGYKSLDKGPSEYIEKVYFELGSSLFNFEKVSKRTHLDIATVNTAISLRMEGDKIQTAGLSAGGVAPVPLFLKASAAFLVGKRITPAVISGLIECVQAEISPISDARGSETYKRQLLGQLIKAHFTSLFKGRKIIELMEA